MQIYIAKIFFIIFGDEQRNFFALKLIFICRILHYYVTIATPQIVSPSIISRHIYISSIYVTN